MALEETQEASRLIKIAEPMAKSREQLHTLIRQVIAEELGTPRAPAAAKEGSGESVRPGRHAGTDPAQPDVVDVRGFTRAEPMHTFHLRGQSASVPCAAYL